ncbi:MAG TPA: ABC transporter substrate-binding protein [Gaiella sp.]|uniref:ABC transporter substrate-binding protein n=1 Tax=Gaiella sp. TaxID=2663207 RepID=UPI002D811289|nr:ABC transporter substrate-binding protein [Gaiella sp.]HET9288479.1 ABC transporter substrate-binding protein [Gaiella sp.]
MTGRLSLTLALLVVGTALLGASAVARTDGEAPKGGTLRMSRFSDVDFVDPALAYASWSWPVGYATCAKLFNYPDAGGAAGTRLEPEVVDRFTVSKDGRTYTFALKRTFRFHTGARVTAQSFADALNRVAQPRLGSPATAYMHEIVGAAAVIDGKADSISGVRVLGRYRLQIRLTRPLGDFTARLTLPFFCPVLPSPPVDPAGTDSPPGSGPYYVAERVANQRIVLERNPYYRGKRAANIDRVVWAIGNTRESCLADAESDRMDFCGTFGVPTGAYRTLAERYGINRGQFLVRPSLTTWFFAFNHARPAFAGRGQIPLKKAINYAIDRPDMARAFGYLAGRRTDQMLPPALARPARIYPHAGADPTSARTWLRRAALQPRELVLYANNNPTGVAIAQVLAFNLRQIGIDLQIKYFDTVSLTEKASVRSEPFDLIMIGWSADYADAAAFFIPLLSRADARNGVNLDDARLERRMKSLSRLTGERRRTAWADFDVELMRDNPPWAPFVHTQNRTFVSRSTGCVVDHPVYGFDLAAVCKKR